MLKRQKSIISDAASISAWNAVFDCPSIVAAFSVDAPRRRQQFRRAEHHRRAILPRPAAPLAARLGGGGDRLLDVLRAGEVILGQHVLVVVRHDRLRGAAGPDFLPPMTSGISTFSAAMAFRRAFSSARSGLTRGVGAVGVVDRLGTRRTPANAAVDAGADAAAGADVVSVFG